jgi:hypothetical protein
VTRLADDVELAASAPKDAEGAGGGRWLPALIALAVVALVVALVVAFSPSAWRLLGAGRGLVPEAYYPLSGFAVVMATTVGQAVGWAAGSFLLFHVMTLVGFRPDWTTARLAATAVYFGLAGVPLGVFHVLYGGWLLGMPRVGLEEWLAGNHPDAYWLLVTAHPFVDLSLIPLAGAVFTLLWRRGDRLRHDVRLQTAFWLCLLGTSLAVALSLAVHSALVHIRL